MLRVFIVFSRGPFTLIHFLNITRHGPRGYPWALWVSCTTRLQNSESNHRLLLARTRFYQKIQNCCFSDLRHKPKFQSLHFVGIVILFWKRYDKTEGSQKRLSEIDSPKQPFWGPGLTPSIPGSKPIPKKSFMRGFGGCEISCEANFLEDANPCQEGVALTNRVVGS